jgi:hypothetical protein
LFRRFVCLSSVYLAPGLPPSVRHFKDFLNRVIGVRTIPLCYVIRETVNVPAAKKRLSGTKRGAGIISAVSHMAEDDQTPITTGGKPSVGKTGVHLRYHKKQEYNKLSQEQKDELREWRENSNVKPTDKSDGRGKKKSYTKKQLASLVTKGVKLAMDKSLEELKTQDDTKAYIMSLIQEVVAPGTTSQASVTKYSGHTRLYLKLHSEQG